MVMRKKQELVIRFDKTCDRSAYLADYARAKFSRRLEKLGSRFTHVTLKCSVVKKLHTLQMFVRLPKTPEIIASAASESMYEAVDNLVPKFNQLVHRRIRSRNEFKHIPLANALQTAA